MYKCTYIKDSFVISYENLPGYHKKKKRNTYFKIIKKYFIIIIKPRDRVPQNKLSDAFQFRFLHIIIPLITLVDKSENKAGAFGGN